MKKVSDIIAEVENRSIRRFKYEPYSMDVALKVWKAIAREMIGSEVINEEPVMKLWHELIRYVQGDSSFGLDLRKSIGLLGATGTGKTLAMNIMNTYSKIDDVMYMRGTKIIKFQFKVVSARELVSAYASSGYDGIMKFIMMANLCIDDIGSEELESNYYGTKLRVVNEMIEERYRKGLLTHFTANLTEAQIEDTYNDRVYSRLRHTVNLITLNTKDFRI